MDRAEDEALQLQRVGCQSHLNHSNHTWWRRPWTQVEKEAIVTKAENEARRIFGERAAFYTTSAAHTDPEVLARVVALAAPEREWIALDIATGTGHTAFALAGHVRLVVGTDVTPEMVREAKTLRATRGIVNVAFTLADVHCLPFPSAAFHLITCRRAAHHFSQIRRALAEMRRVLRAGARLVIDDRSVPEDDFVDTCMNQLDRYHDPSHVRQYRPSEWRRLLEGQGFSVEAIEPYTRHRPLTSFTGKASPEGVRGIHATIAGLTSVQREALGFREVNGEPFLSHWYCTLVAHTSEA
jgi:ubiquinone/menaquinone biosynthesis C-methylase UbiE